MNLQETYLELLAGWGDSPLDEQSVKMVLQMILEQGYADCRADMKTDLTAVVGMLRGGVKQPELTGYIEKVAHYIEKYLLEGNND